MYTSYMVNTCKMLSAGLVYLNELTGNTLKEEAGLF